MVNGILLVLALILASTTAVGMIGTIIAIGGEIYRAAILLFLVGIFSICGLGAVYDANARILKEEDVVRELCSQQGGSFAGDVCIKDGEIIEIKGGE